MGYGIVESRSGRLRMVDGGTFDHEAGRLAPDSGSSRSTRFLDELIALHKPDLARRRAAVLLDERPDRVRGRPGAGRRAARRGAGRGARPRGHAERGQDRGHRLRPARTRSRSGGWSRSASASPSRPDPDDTADALAVAIWAANAERPGIDRRSSVLDRASVNPMTSNAGDGNGYERAVREALANGEGARRTREPSRERRQPRGRSRDRLARRRRRGGRLRLADRRGRRGRLPGLRLAVGARLGGAGRAG